MTKPLLKVLNGETLQNPPVWFMRQAGRHLPEYLETRSQAKNFIDFCFRPDLAAEATLQPIRRYGMDGAILFADILLIPIGLGRRVDFIKGTGPVLDPITLSDIDNLTLDGAADRINPVYETVGRVKSDLPKSTTLIGFCGAPWTVATYMIEGRGTPDKSKAKRMAYEHPEACEKLFSAIADASAEYLARQVEAGAEAVKIFESWASGLSPYLFERCVIRPTQRLITAFRKRCPDTPIIGFPKGAGLHYRTYLDQLDITAIAAGTEMPLNAMRDMAGPDMAIQGNLDPLVLAIGGHALDRAVDEILETARGPHIFNLGHGVTPDVPIKNVEAVLKRIRS